RRVAMSYATGGLACYFLRKVNWSAELFGLLPLIVSTVISTVPPVFTLGETAVIEVAEFTVKLLALVKPKRTDVAPVKPVPVMVTVVPPLGGPWLGSTFVTVGAGGGWT